MPLGGGKMCDALMKVSYVSANTHGWFDVWTCEITFARYCRSFICPRSRFGCGCCGRPGLRQSLSRFILTNSDACEFGAESGSRLMISHLSEDLAAEPYY